MNKSKIAEQVINQFKAKLHETQQEKENWDIKH